MDREGVVRHTPTGVLGGSLVVGDEAKEEEGEDEEVVVVLEWAAPV